MQLKTSYSSKAVNLIGSRLTCAFPGWFCRPDGTVEPHTMELYAVVPTDTITDTVDIPLSRISTGRAANSFRDHGCAQVKYEGALYADLTTCPSITGDPSLPKPYSRGTWSYLDYRLPPNIGSGLAMIPLNQDFYLNYWEPESWDSPDRRPKNYYTSANFPRFNTVRSVIIDGFAVVLCARIYFRYSSNNHYTGIRYTIITSCREVSTGNLYCFSKDIRNEENENDAWSYYPNYSGFETEHSSLVKGELPYRSQDFGAVKSWLASRRSQGYVPVSDGTVLTHKSVGSVPNVDKLMDQLDEFFQSRRSKVVYPDLREFWQIAECAIQDCQSVGINSIAFLKDLPDFGQDILQISKTVKSLSSKKKAVKAIAKQFLALNYGTRLTVDDMKSIRKSITRNMSMTSWRKDFSKVHAMSTSVASCHNESIRSRAERHYKVYYNPNDAALCRFMKGLNDLGLYPTGENLWDLIPFSFVVDWFVNVGDMLKSVDVSNYCIYLNILSCVYSEKYVTEIDDFRGLYPYVGTITQTSYSRHVSDKLHQPKLDLQLQNTFSNHVLELTAIAVSRHR